MTSFIPIYLQSIIKLRNISLCIQSIMIYVLPQRLKHLLDTSLLLLHIWVNIEVEGCCNVGMTKQYAYGLVVAVAFNAACGKAVAQSVIL